MNKKVLVTGGTGYIGSHTTVCLIESGYTPVLIDNFSNSSADVLGGIEKITGIKPIFYEADVCNTKQLEEIINKEDISQVIHFAAFKAVGESVKDPLKYYKNNINGLVSVLSALNNRDVVNFVFSSSATVYGVPDKLPITEDSPLKTPSSPYGATKQIGEQIITDVMASNPSLHATLLRYFNPVGAHSSALIGELPLGTPNNLVPFVAQATAGIRDKLTIFGSDYPTPDGTCIRDYLHVMDLAEAHIKALEHLVLKKNIGTPNIYNLGTGKGSSVLDIVSTFEKTTGEKVPYVMGERRSGDPASLFADVAKAKEDLGWEAKRSLEEALSSVWKWQQHLQA